MYIKKPFLFHFLHSVWLFSNSNGEDVHLPSTCCWRQCYTLHSFPAFQRDRNGKYIHRCAIVPAGVIWIVSIRHVRHNDVSACRLWGSPIGEGQCKGLLCSVRVSDPSFTLRLAVRCRSEKAKLCAAARYIDGLAMNRGVIEFTGCGIRPLISDTVWYYALAWSQSSFL